MKYLKLYEDFNDGIGNYDWQYLFQELIDDFDIKVLPADMDSVTFTDSYIKNFFSFNLVGDSIQDLNIDFDFMYNSEKVYSKDVVSGNSDLSELGDMQEVFVNLIVRIKSLGGDIHIEKSDSYQDTDVIDVYITKNTFKNLT